MKHGPVKGTKTSANYVIQNAAGRWYATFNRTHQCVSWTDDPETAMHCTRTRAHALITRLGDKGYGLRKADVTIVLAAQA